MFRVVTDGLTEQADLSHMIHCTVPLQEMFRGVTDGLTEQADLSHMIHCAVPLQEMLHGVQFMCHFLSKTQ
jgi:hypothetical protein